MNAKKTLENATGDSDEEIRQKCVVISRILCAVSAIFPMAAAIGWTFNISFLTQVNSGLPAMQPNTIAGLVLSAICILALSKKLPRSQIFLVSILSLLIAVLGVLTLAEYAFDADFGFDRIFVRQGVDYQQPFSGRPSPQASANFILLGCSVFLYVLRSKKFLLKQVGALFVIANSVFALTGYIFSTGHFFGVPALESTVGIAIHSGVAFVLLAVSLLCSEPSEGIMQLLASSTRSGGVARRISLLCIFMPPVVGIVTRLGYIAGWYSKDTQISLFVVVLIGLVLSATWWVSKQAETDENISKRVLEELKITNDKLRQALDEREIFAAFVENSPDFIGIADSEGKPVYVNPAGRRMVGLSLDASVQDTAIVDYYPPSLQAFASEVIYKAMIKNGRWSGETYFRNWTTGEPISVSDEHFMICEKLSGRRLGMGTITRDTTQIKKVQEKLEQSERRFRSIFDNSMDAVLLTSAEGAIVMANHAAAVMFGYSEDELKMLGRQAVVDSTDPQLAMALDERHRTGRFRGEITMKRRDGSHFPVELSSAVFKDRQGAEWTSMFIRDITDRKKLEYEREGLLKQVDLERLWLKAVFEGAPIGMVMVHQKDPEHPIPNEHARKVFGARIDWKKGRSSYIGLAFDAKGIPLSKEQLTSSRVLRGETIIGEEQLLKFADGRDFPVIVAGGPIQDESGTQIGGVTFFQDISLLKELERLREEWSAIIAHDLRQPITIIQALAGLLRRLPETSETGKKFAERIESSAKQLNRMTNDLLDVSQLEANKLKLEQQLVGPVKLLHDIVDKLRPLYLNNEIKLKVDEPMERINVDPGRLEQVVGNLISNASKYGNPKTDILLTVSQNCGVVEIAITNRGKGIDPEELGALFQRFHRTKLGKVEGIKGIGLGLYIARGLIEAHGGSISAVSVPGEFTTFKIHLPAENSRRLENSVQRAG